MGNGASVSTRKKKSGPYSQPLSRHWLINAVPKLVSKLNKSTSSSLQRGEGAVTTAFVCNETLQEPLTRIHNSNPDEKDFDNWDVILNEVGAMEDGDDVAGVLVVKSLDKLECPAAKKKRAVRLPSTLTGSIGDCCEAKRRSSRICFLGTRTSRCSQGTTAKRRGPRTELTALFCRAKRGTRSLTGATS